MSYVESSLTNGETIKLNVKVSWWSEWLGAIVAVCLMPFAFSGLIVALFLWLRVRSTEFAATDRRIIAKRGIIARRTHEIGLKKVESIQVDQGIFGRIFNYGTIIVSGTGTTTAKIPAIDDPMIVRRRLQEIVDQAQHADSHTSNVQNTVVVQ